MGPDAIPAAARRARHLLSCSASAIVQGMEIWIGVLAFFVVWILLQTWLLPRLGVPT
jgi:hypothetical protein